MSITAPQAQTQLVNTDGTPTPIFLKMLGAISTMSQTVDANTKQLGLLPSQRLKGSKTFNPPSIAGSGVTTTTVTVTGAALGQKADASFSLDVTGLMLDAEVTSANTVTVSLFNPTAGAIDLASGTLSAFVWGP